MANLIDHGSVSYNVIPLDSCLAFATELQNAGKHWHSHVLSPGCEHNPYEGQYAIVIEDDAEAKAYIAASDGFPEVDKVLVKILHGDDILDPNKTAAATGTDPVSSPLLERLRDIDARDVPWHHHMNFPSCAFNPTKGRWAITVESLEGNFHESFDDEPIDVLREVEVLYFGKLDKHNH